MKHRKISNYPKNHLDRGSPELEENITSRIERLIKTQEGKDRLRKMKKLQMDFFVGAAERVYSEANREDTFWDYIELMDNLMGETRFICDANEFHLESPQELVVVTGHFGIAKATKISSSEFKAAISQKIRDDSWIYLLRTPPNNEAFPLRNSAIFKTLYKVFGKNNISPHEVHMCYPYPFDEIQKDCGVVTIRLDSNNQYAQLEREMDIRFSSAKMSEKIPIAIIFPEEGTSGKRDLLLNPYGLGEFRKGFAAYAIHRRALVLPIVQIVGQGAEFYTAVLNPIEPPNMATRESISSFVKSIRISMQKRIDFLLKKYRDENLPPV